MKTLSGIGIGIGMVALLFLVSVNAQTPPANTAADRSREIRDLEEEIQQMTDTLNSLPSNQIGMRQPLERRIHEKQRVLFEKQRVLAGSGDVASPGKKGAEVRLTRGQAKSLAEVAALWKSGKESESLDAWKKWLKSNQRPDPKVKDDLKFLGGWVAERASGEAETRAAIQRRLVDAAGD